ncbi:tyrosine-type recombinase/integrase [Mesorhizobium captivum]|uniref:tyrosine-type recombinase/integrase n=1 Tax=Mesorhizobium captivum TaxID=3072319 RepID=UPI002A240B68|nr:integrase arm-type DNA-binding domain-containing protein [Mesorhizobium sp. VK3C]MDX8445330.1 tyrosine-type recombinase/integrase [Mesorhizobium sp. VK3C]
MARPKHKLADATVKSGKLKPGRHGDGAGLFLQVEEEGGSRSWLFMWKRDGRRSVIGLGGYPDTSLALAREKAEACRNALARGEDPRLALRMEQAEPTFGEAVGAFLDEDREASWRNEKHRAQWRMTLLGPAEQKGKRRRAPDYCRHLRPMKVSEIGTEDVLAVLKPVWRAKPETASRLRGRIERVLAFAKGQGWRSGENPAQWKNHLDALLPKPEKLKARGHHRALPFQGMPGFYARLRQRKAPSARALEFAILTAARSGEVLGARWSEIDLAEKVWSVPASRMKAGRAHEVPLVLRAIEILTDMAELRREDDEYVFPGQKPKRPLSQKAVDNLLERMKAKETTTVHGFRSSFRDWAGDATNFPRELAEAALAHVVGDKAEQAYRRGTALERRRKLMTAWAGFLASGATADVIPLAERRRAKAK